MSDISKCFGEGCPVRALCKRYTAPASGFQSYIVIEHDPKNGCDMFVRDENAVPKRIKGDRHFENLSDTEQ